MGLSTRPWVDLAIFGVVLTVLAELMTRLWTDFFPDQQLNDDAVMWLGIGVSVAVLCVAVVQEFRGRSSK